MPRIAHIATLWSLMGHPRPKGEWSLARKISAIAAAGFDGLITRLTPEHRRLSEKEGLHHLLGFVSSSQPDEFAVLLRQQKEGGAVHINVQLDDDDTPPALAVKHWVALERTAEKIGGLIVSLEIHRDTCTETPEKTDEIADRYHAVTGRSIRLTCDHSHFAVVKHLRPENYIPRLLARPGLVQHAEQCHFRPFNGHHCQVPVTQRGRLTPEVISYLKFAGALMACWKAAPRNRHRTLFACPEMGCFDGTGAGGGYNISGLPSAWPEAVRLREELAKAWRHARRLSENLPTAAVGRELARALRRE